MYSEMAEKKHLVFSIFICIFASAIQQMEMINNDILSQLNDSQRVAVEYCDGASLVIAGAGSGKTRVLIMLKTTYFFS